MQDSSYPGALSISLNCWQPKLLAGVLAKQSSVVAKIALHYSSSLEHLFLISAHESWPDTIFNTKIINKRLEA